MGLMPFFKFQFVKNIMKYICKLIHYGEKNFSLACVLIWRLENTVTIWGLLTGAKICHYNNGFCSANIHSEYLPILHLTVTTRK